MNKAVIFDMDGVIFDSEALVLACWKIIGESYGISGIDEVFRRCIGTNTAETKKIVQDYYGEDFDYEHFREKASVLFQEKTKEKGVPVKRGARELLSYLKINGYRIGLATSTRRVRAEEELEQAGLLKYFQTVVCGDMVSHSKPHPEIYELACSGMGLDPASVYAIEDSFHGVRSASAAGMKVIMVPDMIAPDEEMKELAWQIYPSLMGVLGLFQSF